MPTTAAKRIAALEVREIALEALIDTPIPPKQSIDLIDPDFLASFRKEIERLWPSEERTGPLGLAVSGGPDSLALLLLAQASLPGEIAVASVDHGLRAEAKDEIALVQRLCRELDIPFTALTVSVTKGNLQARAREARYGALARWAADEGIGAIATAHHANDQAETLLMRLARGSGLSGLAGVREATVVPGTSLPLIRPLLWASKDELQAVLAITGVEAAQDPSNEDLRFDRVRVRRHLAQHDWLDPVNLAESAQHLAEGWRAIEWYAQCDWEEMVHRENGEAGGEYRYFVNVPRIVAIETIVRIIGELGGLVSRSEAGRAYDRLWREENASLGGVLAVPGIERVETVGVAMRVWRFSPEPPRTAH